MNALVLAATVAMRYRKMAVTLEARAREETAHGLVIHAAQSLAAARIARRAADAETKNPEPA